MIVMLAREFGWTIDHILAMPVRRFFAVYSEVVRLRAVDLVNACDIAAIPLCGVEQYYRPLRNGFLKALKKDTESNHKSKLKSAPLEGAKAQASMQTLFQLKRRFS